MKVEVSIIKRPAVKVEVTLAKARRKGYCVQIPVRVAQDEILPVSDVEETLLPDAESADAEDVCTPVPEEETDESAADLCQDAEDTSASDIAVEAEDIDEDDLLALIAEEEAEMQAQQIEDRIEEEFVDSFDKAAESAGFFADSESAELPADEISASEAPPSTEQFYRYFGRNNSGERFEVDNSNASGQEIVCVDGESGRISRVCGFIRHNQPEPDTEEE